jgi:hypothetical protein
LLVFLILMVLRNGLLFGVITYAFNAERHVGPAKRPSECPTFFSDGVRFFGSRFGTEYSAA